MSTLNLIITTAGQAALAQAGTLGPVVISKVAIGSGTWTTAPTASATALHTQIKQLDPSGSSTPSAGVIHITATDSDSSAYAVYEMGLYTSTGVLFAIAGGTTLFLTKATSSSALFSIDLAITNVPSGSIVIGDTGFSYPQATETVKGVAEIATTAEVTAGTDDTRIVTPLKLAAGNFLSKSGGTVTGAILSSVTPTASTHLTNKAYVDGTVSKAVNGYCIMPNGLIMQWGRTDTYGGYQTITLPIPFPTACLWVSGTTGILSTGVDNNSTSAGKNGTSLSTIVVTDDGAGCNWFAIGY